MADWEQLRELTQRVEPPPFASLERAARARDRRSRAVVGVLAVLLLVGAGFGLARQGDEDDALLPAQDPTESVPVDTEDVRELPPDPGSGSVTLDAGRYRVPLRSGLAFDIDLPEGTAAHDRGLYLATPDLIVKTEVAGAAYGVPVSPCTSRGTETAGTTVDDLVRALTSLPVYEVSPPEPVELGGASGSYLEARIPRGYVATDCIDGTLQLPGNPGTAAVGPPPYVGRWWVLDVEGVRVVVQQNCWGCSAARLERGGRAAESITFAATG